jgi:hypothetical protein
MTTRIVLLAFVLVGCESYATRTRATPTGGSYVLSLARSTDDAVQSTARDVIQDIQQQCNGRYEVVSIAAVAVESGEDGFYLDPDDQPAVGPYRTMVSYECHAPGNAALNHRLYLLAGPSVKMAGHGEHLVRHQDDEVCYETWDCPPGAVCEPKSCDE